MKLSYIANMRLPSDRAHAWQIMRMCQAFANNNHDVTLYVPKRKTDSDKNPFEYYNLQPNFKIKRIPVIDLFPIKWMPRKIAYWVNTFTFSIGLMFKLGKMKKGIVYSRDPFSTFAIGRFVKDWCYEVHDSPKKTFLNKILFGGIKHVVATNTWKRNQLADTFNLNKDEMNIAHHGVDVDVFAELPQKHEAFRVTGLSPQYNHVVYTGHLFEWKGVYALARASRFLDQNTRVVLVGGTPEDVEKMQDFIDREQLDRVQLTGFKQRADMLHYVACADLFVIPTSAKFQIGMYESSPLKLFEYMATGKPIVATDLPAIRDIVDETMVEFCEPDKASQLAQIITQTLEQPSQQKIQTAADYVKKNTWEARAKKLVTFIHGK